MSDSVSTISVVICAYTEERWPQLVKAIASVRNQTLLPREIILVVDHNPRLLARAKGQLRDVIVIENRQARGLYGARNSGIAVARGEIVAFIDEDATAAPDWLAWLNCYYGDPQVLGVGGAIEPLWQAGRPKWFPPEFDWVVGWTYRGVAEVTHRVRNLIGCNMSFRGGVFQKIGGLRDGIGRIGRRPVGCEETELCIRLNQQQPYGRLLYEPRSRVYHQVAAGRSRWRYFVARCYAEGLSKAIVSRLVGASDGLSSERAYTFQTLPRGVARGLADTVRHRDATGLARSVAIVVGLAVTLMSYMYGSIVLCRTNSHAINQPVNRPSEQS